MPRPRGPLTLLASSRNARWTLATIVALPILYVLSSGPTRQFLARERVPDWVRQSGPSMGGSWENIVVYDYWNPLYLPLVWYYDRRYDMDVDPQAADVRFLWTYWDRFPIPED